MKTLVVQYIKYISVQTGPIHCPQSSSNIWGYVCMLSVCVVEEDPVPMVTAYPHAVHNVHYGPIVTQIELISF